MYCPRCGVALPSDGQRFCASCGAPIPAPPSPAAAGATATAETLRRPSIVTLLAVVQFLGAAGTLLLAALLFILTRVADEPAARSVLAIIGGGAALVGGLQIVCGVGLWTLRPYGRILQIVFACLSLINIPFGTVIGILILIYMTKPGARLLFSGRPPADFTETERAELAAAQVPNGVVIAVIAVAGVFFFLIVGAIAAAIIIPGLMRARASANEAGALSRVRAMQAAQVAYATGSNGGYYDSPECLVRPAECLSSFTGGGFLDASYLPAGARGGYLFRFEAGPAPDPSAGGARPISRSSVTSYAYIAEPERPYRTGARSFCADSTGLVCELPASRLVVVTGGACPTDCQSIR